MKYLSVCSGIEAASVAWGPLGFTPVAFSEIEAFPSAVLRHHYPDVPNWGDMTNFRKWPDATIDVLVGGTPCQSFSVAGFRKGLADPRGNLALTFLAIADRYRPRWIAWENVPGVFSAVSHTAPDPRVPPDPLDVGRDGATVETDDEYDSEEVHAFACFLAGLAELGYGVGYGTLDAQYFGLAQRRERVFVVGCLGGWSRCAAVFFERGCLSGDPSPRREAGENVAPGVSCGAPFSRTGNERVEADALVAGTLEAGSGKRRHDESGTMIPDVAGTLGGSSQSGGFRTTDLDNSGAFIPDIVPQAMSAKWSKGSSGPAGDEIANLVAFDTTQITHPENRSNPQPGGPTPQLTATAHPPTIAFSVKDHGGDATEELAPTLRAGNEVGGNASGGVMPAIAFEPRVASGRRAGTIGDTVPALTKESDRGDGFPCVAYALGSHAGAADGDQTNRNHETGGPVGSNVSEELAYSLRSERTQSVASIAPEPFAFESRVARNGRGAPSELVPPLKAQSGETGKGDGSPLVVAVQAPTRRPSQHGSGVSDDGDPMFTLSASEVHAVGFADVADPVAANQARTYTREGTGNFRMSNVAHTSVQVRRLTPRECERLQGFPDDYTLIPYRGKLAADGPRYKALGNSMAVPVMAWIGQRIQLVDAIEAVDE